MLTSLIALATIAVQYRTMEYGGTLDLSAVPAGTKVYIVPGQTVTNMQFPQPTLFVRSGAVPDGKIAQKVTDGLPWLDACVRFRDGKPAGNAGEIARWNVSDGVVRYWDSDPVGTYRDELWPTWLFKVKGAKGLDVEVIGRVKAPSEILIDEDCSDTKFKVSGDGNLVRVHGDRPAVFDVRGARNSYTLDVSSLGCVFRANGTVARVTVSGKLQGCGVLRDMGVVYVNGKAVAASGSVSVNGAYLYRFDFAGDKPNGFDVGLYGDNVSAKAVASNCEFYSVKIGVLLGGTTDCSVTGSKFFGVRQPVVQEDRSTWLSQLAAWFPNKEYDGRPARNAFSGNLTDTGLVSSKPDGS